MSLTPLLWWLAGVVGLGLVGWWLSRSEPDKSEAPEPPRCTAPGPYGAVRCLRVATEEIGGEPRCRFCARKERLNG